MSASGKFAGVDFSEAEVEKLTPDLEVSGQGFRCNRGEFVTYWRQGRVQREVDARISQCWIIRHGDALAGYITLLADKLVVDEQILEEEGVQYRTFPAVKIGLLAADRRAKGCGRRLVEWALEYVATEIASLLGVRFMTVDALYDPDTNPPYNASSFYERFGFQFANLDEVLPPPVPYRTMYLDLKPLIDLLSGEDLEQVNIDE
ncbi:GNAT family N-acetyltransferase [Argonema antarcticum]|uniref:GNAT family N-acetyltransferase n=1 Tax=Argonema antarcticum TaxID=2942763 RepID=UPI002011D350|nr:GNAT family N-acetyltransferase [Argonema antarcticum]MCL1475999.1 GNAT family N-acetyltransferase [Argonema antarcticum A004/B2]